jgi:hypothetical protein
MKINKSKYHKSKTKTIADAGKTLNTPSHMLDEHEKDKDKKAKVLNKHSKND